METILKSKENLINGDTLKRKDKEEYITVKGSYYFDNNPDYKYILFNGYSIPKDFLHNFLKMEEGKYIVYNMGK